MFELNTVGVLVAGVAAWVFGMIWYSPALFGKAWMKMKGMDGQMKPDAKVFILGIVASIVTAYVLARIFVAFNAEDIGAAVETAFWVWLGFFATTALNGYLYNKEPLNLYLLNVAYYLGAIVVMGIVLISI